MPLHCTLNRDVLYDALAKVQNITSRKSNFAILSNVLIESENNFLLLTATDLEVGVRLRIPAEIIENGSITLPSKKIFEIVRESGSPSVTLAEKEKSWVVITAGMSTYNLAGLESSEYPEFPENENDSFVTIQASVILDLIDKTIFSIANEQENIYSLTSVLFEKEKREGISFLKMISSDGHRLSIMEKEVIFDVDQLCMEGVILIPKRGVQEWKKFCEGRDEIDVCFEGKQLFIREKDSIMVIRLKQGEFPAYQSIVHTVHKNNCAHIPRKPFLESLKRIDLFTEDIFHTVQIQIDSEKIVLSSQNADIGNAKDEQNISYSGEQLRLGFNCRYFIETLQVMECELVDMYIDSNNSPCLFTSETDKGFISIVMPMNI